MALLSWRVRFEGLPKKGRLRLQRIPVGQAEFNQGFGFCLSGSQQEKKLVYCFKSGAGEWW